ncbi:MAG: primosomal protein N' [Gammaproteobacteria bacterium]|nr:primosomal protein N' [Gammaproteobacteria bacterium]
MSLFSSTVLEIALPVPLRRTFDYLIIERESNDSDDNLTLYSPTIGGRVLVPFGKQTLVGVILKIKNESDYPFEKLKAIQKVIDQEPVFNEKDMHYLTWAAQYFQHPIGEVFHAALPKLLRENKQQDDLYPQVLTATDSLPTEYASNATAQKELYLLLSSNALNKEQLKQKEIKSTTIKRFVDEGWATWQKQQPTAENVTTASINEHLQLNTEQAIAVSAVNQSQGHQSFLLEGVTGSGKTEVYLQVIEQVLLSQQQVLVCVPEIGLTPQTIQRFEQRFNVPVALWHSGMTDTQRASTWLATKTGQAKIVIATRSGVFLPFADLGMVIIDEEHDLSFKQQETFKYHCRSIALYRANQLSIPVVLGSATPSLESLANAINGKYHHLKLLKRAAGSQLPSMRLLDLNQCRVEAGIGEPLLERIKQTLNNGQQVMLFINRRGFAPVLMCEECNWLSDCHRCSGYSTYHKSSNALICHHCGDQQPVVHQCHNCGSTRITTVGVGTEQLHLTLNQLFPDFPVIRLDRDSTAKKGEFDQKLEQIHQGKPKIIVGTQMVAKGHHFPNVSLVGIVDVDGTLFSSDFRAPERLAQLVVQVAGRAGRGSIKGEVWLQTKFPEHPVIQDLVNNQYADFANYALTEREMLGLPPYSHQIVLRAEATAEEYAAQWLQNVAPHLNQFGQLLMLGPMPAPMSRKAGKYRYLLTLQCKSRPYLHKVVNWLIENLDSIQKDNRIRWSIDVDPVDFS